MENKKKSVTRMGSPAENPFTISQLVRLKTDTGSRGNILRTIGSKAVMILWEGKDKSLVRHSVDEIELAPQTLDQAQLDAIGSIFQDPPR